MERKYIITIVVGLLIVGLGVLLAILLSNNTTPTPPQNEYTVILRMKQGGDNVGFRDSNHLHLREVEFFDTNDDKITPYECKLSSAHAQGGNPDCSILYDGKYEEYTHTDFGDDFQIGEEGHFIRFKLRTPNEISSIIVTSRGGLALGSRWAARGIIEIYKNDNSDPQVYNIEDSVIRTSHNFETHDSGSNNTEFEYTINN